MLAKSNRYHWLAVIVLLLAGMHGIYNADADFISVDELHSIGNMGGFNSPYGVAQIVTSLGSNSPDQVPLWYFIASAMAQLTGWSQAALRISSVLTSLLMFAALYRFVRELFDARTALFALILLSTIESLRLYLHYVRMYPLLMLLTIVHCWMYWRLAQGDRRSGFSWLLFVLTAAGILYTHIFGALFLIGLGLNHLFLVARSRLWGKIIACWAFAALLFLPYLPVLQRGLSFNVGKNVATDDVFDIIPRLLNILSNGDPLLGLPLLLALVYALWNKRNVSAIALLRIGLIGCAIYLLLKIFLIDTLITRPRYFFPLLFCFTIPLAHGLSSSPRWFFSLFITIWCLAYYVDTSAELGPNHNIHLLRQTVLQPLEHSASPLDMFVSAFDATERSTKRRKHGYSAVDLYLRQLGINSTALRPGIRPNQVESVAAGLSKYPQILLGYHPAKMPAHLPLLLGYIPRDFVACAVLIDEPSMFVQRYASRLFGCEHEPKPLTYTNNIRLFDRYACYDPGQERLHILTGLESADAQQRKDYNVSWQIITSDWQNVRQVDRHLHDSMWPWAGFEMSGEGLAAGTYRLMMIVYRNDTGAKASYRDPDSNQLAKFLPILEFAVGDDGDTSTCGTLRQDTSEVATRE